jgi:ubiquinone/menaquinone biosynthesis C-methylase UbiE
MSTYEDYGDASQHYDGSRVSFGLEIILGHLAAGTKPLDEIHLLDAGCGTGNYAAPLAPYVGKLTLLDGSAEMLAVATAKLAAIPEAGPVDAHHGTLQALPFEDASFDAVMTNQVLHHLGDLSGDDWPQHRAAFAEYGRVLRPGGVLILNVCSPEQIENGWWAFSLIPTGRAEMARRYAPLEVLEDLARESGLTPVGRAVPTDATIQGDDYFDPEGPLSAEWRRADSTWSLAPEDEIEAMITTLTALRDAGELDAFVAQHDARRLHVGQTTFLAARRD